MTKKIGIAFLVLIVLAAGYIAVAPSSIDPVGYKPPANPGLTGAFAPRELLDGIAFLETAGHEGPEDMAVDEGGKVYTGTADGAVLRISDDGAVEIFAETKGRPLGLHFDAEGDLIVCDAYRGLLSIDRRGTVTALAMAAGGRPFRFTNGLDIADDGIIYFSDSSDTFYQKDYLYDILEAKPHGRLMSHDPKTGKTQVLLNGLYFPNGVALSAKEDFVAVCETSRYRITRYWLRGPKRGTSDVLVDNLPGFPDGISADGEGTFWIALPTLRNEIMDRIHPYPIVKKILSKLPRVLMIMPKPYGLVAAADEKGQIVRSLHDPSGEHIDMISSARKHGGVLYLGTLGAGRIGVHKPEGRQ